MVLWRQRRRKWSGKWNWIWWTSWVSCLLLFHFVFPCCRTSLLTVTFHIVISGFADQSQYAASTHSFGPGGSSGSASSSFGYAPGERAGANFMSFAGLGHAKSASAPEWFRGVGRSGRLVAGEMA